MLSVWYVHMYVCQPHLSLLVSQVVWLHALLGVPGFCFGVWAGFLKLIGRRFSSGAPARITSVSFSPVCAAPFLFVLVCLCVCAEMSLPLCVQDVWLCALFGRYWFRFCVGACFLKLIGRSFSPGTPARNMNGYRPSLGTPPYVFALWTGFFEIHWKDIP